METALILACQNKEKKKIENLLLQGVPNLNFQDVFGNTALHYLCMGDDHELAEIVIVMGGNVELENNQQATPLHIAAANGNIPLVNMLLERGADINAHDIEDKTPLIYAISGGQEGIAEYLISTGADKYSRTINGLSPIDFARAADMDTLIPFFDGRFPWIDNKGNSNLHNAVYQSGISVIRNILSANKSDIDARNNEGLTPLLISVSRLNFGVSELLLEFGANPNLTRLIDAYTPLHIAAENGVSWLGENLLKYGADINARNQDGASPLMLAILGQHKDFCALLINKGAALGISDNQGKIARDYALERAAKDIVGMIDKRSSRKPDPGKEDD